VSSFLTAYQHTKVYESKQQYLKTYRVKATM